MKKEKSKVVFSGNLQITQVFNHPLPFLGVSKAVVNSCGHTGVNCTKLSIVMNIS